MNLISMFSSFSMAVFPPVLAVLVTAFLPLVFAAVFKWMERNGLDIEANHREALQSALTNAAQVALQRALGGSTPPTIRAGDKVGQYVGPVEIVPNVGAGIDYVLKSVPDALNAFKLDTGRIRDLLEPHIVEAAKQAGVTTKSN